MKIPIYDSSKVDRSHDNILLEEDELLNFEGFIGELINADVLDHKTQLGIFKLVLDKGTKVLSNKQLNVIKTKIESFDDKCQGPQCISELTWKDIDVYNDESYCPDCRHTKERIKNAERKDQ